MREAMERLYIDVDGGQTDDVEVMTFAHDGKHSTQSSLISLTLCEYLNGAKRRRISEWNRGKTRGYLAKQKVGTRWSRAKARNDETSFRGDNNNAVKG